MMTFVILAISSTNNEVQLIIAESSRVLKKDQEKVLTNMFIYMYMFQLSSIFWIMIDKEFHVKNYECYGIIRIYGGSVFKDFLGFSHWQV